MEETMKNPIEKPSAPSADAATPVRYNDVLLRAEVAFWRDMLASETDSLPGESIERIRQALALAESRLLCLVLHECGPDASSDRPEGSSAARPRSLH